MHRVFRRGWDAPSENPVQILQSAGYNRHPGCLFFGYFLLATQKKVSRLSVREPTSKSSRRASNTKLIKSPEAISNFHELSAIDALRYRSTHPTHLPLAIKASQSSNPSPSPPTSSRPFPPCHSTAPRNSSGCSCRISFGWRRTAGRGR